MTANDDAAAAADEAEVDRHWVSTVKDVVTIGKSVFIILATVKAAFQWRKSDMKMGKAASALLMFNALIVALVTIYKHTSKTISPLFFLQALSNYSAYLTFVVLLTYVDCDKIIDIRKKWSKVMAGMHVAWWLVIIIGTLLCKCKDKAVYPISFVMSDLLFFATYYFLWELKKLKLDGAWAGKTSEADMKAKELFEVQVKTFFDYYGFLCKWHFVELVLGKLLFAHVLKGAV